MGNGSENIGRQICECGFLGSQDTMWNALGTRPPLLLPCHVEGAKDFIFGTCQSFYEGRQSSDDPGGFVFKGRKFFDTVRTYLGRVWGPYSRVIFQRTTMTSDIIPQGWDAWKFPGKE
ncbi:hypothetical protein V6N12_026756 [Hibiscus sabdariffa]|uniref:pectinesterase n=1 Tax=Hibiscus sabdariffa TaxID=183260 RepID=A0ABR2DSQ2_9ROSI